KRSAQQEPCLRVFRIGLCCFLQRGQPTRLVIFFAQSNPNVLPAAGCRCRIGCSGLLTSCVGIRQFRLVQRRLRCGGIRKICAQVFVERRLRLKLHSLREGCSRLVIPACEFVCLSKVRPDNCMRFRIFWHPPLLGKLKLGDRSLVVCVQLVFYSALLIGGRSTAASTCGGWGSQS